MKSFKQFVVETKSICNKTKKGKYCPSHGTNDCNIEESSKKEDHEYSMARSELSTISNAAKRLRKKMKGEGDIKAWVQSKITKAADYIDTAADYVDSQEIGESCWKGYKKKGMKKMFGKKYPNCVKVEETEMNEEGLRDWFGKSKSKDGKSGWVNVVTGGTCASDEPGEGTPKCVSSSKRASMTDTERKSAAIRKKLADPGQQSKSGAAKPTYVATDVKEESDIKGKGSGTKDACYTKVKSRYSVWPSAYASGALVKCRKVGAANWGTKSESTNSLDGDWHTPIRERADRYCPKCEKLERRSECKYGSRYWDMFSLPAEIISSKKDYNITMPYPANEETNIDENYLRIQTRGSTYTILINWRGKYITTQMFFQQFTRPTKTEVTREIRKVYPNAIVLAFNPSANDPNKPLLFTGEPNGPKSY
jgi:hypothetical protein